MSAPSSQPPVTSRLFSECEGKRVVVECNDGAVYKGKLVKTEENLSCALSRVTVTYPSGFTRDLEDAYLRGVKIRLIRLPEDMQDAPLLRQRPPPSRGFGRGGRRGGGGRGGGGGYRSSYTQRRY